MTNRIQHESTRQFVLEQIGNLGVSWRGAWMAAHLEGAKTFAVTLLIDVIEGVYQDQAEAMVDEAIAKAMERASDVIGDSPAR